MTQYTLPSSDIASDMMRDACLGGAGPSAYCSCGIDHNIHTKNESDTEEEYQRYIHYSELGGQLFVDECDGCQKTLARYERFIWKNRNNIQRYLKIRIDQEKAWANQEALLNKLANI